jgi:spore coat protein U-like protein
MRRALILAALALLLVLGWSGAASAQGCTASATGLAFGTYDPTVATANTTSATVSVSCQAAVQLLVSYTVTLSPGLSGVQTARTLVSGTNAMAYQLYTDTAYSKIWGDGTGGTYTTTDGYLLAVVTAVVRNYTAYGRITARQNSVPGSYTDTITITLTY